jgi:hypothetical protein
MAKRNFALEEMMERGVFNERDVDYFDHLQVPEAAIDDVAMEGIIRAVASNAASLVTNDYRQIKGYFLGMESKRKYIEEICTDLIDWLKEKDLDKKDLDLDMGPFKTWMKTSESFHWRFYFLLEDSVWKNIESDLKADKTTELEKLYSVDFKNREQVTRYLDSIKDIKNLIKVVETYRDRSNKFFELITKRKITIKKFPFQVILAGVIDLRLTVKKIVNLAI